MRLGLTLRKIILAVLIGGLVILAVVALASRRTISDLTAAGVMVSETHEALYRLQALLVASGELQRLTRGYVITGDEGSLGDYEKTRESLQQSVATLAALIRDTPRQRPRIEQLRTLVEHQLAIQAVVIDARRRRGLEASLDVVRAGEGERAIQEIREVVDAFVAEESAQLRAQSLESQARSATAQTIITAGFGLALLLAFASALIVGREIGRRETAQRELSARNRELSEAYSELDRTRREQIAAKDQVLSHVSHELRTPLNAIYQFVTILQDRIAGDLTEPQAEYLAIVLRNVVQLQRMIDDVLEATRAHSGKLTFTPAPMDLGVVAGDLIRILRSRAGEKDLTLTLDLAPEVPPVYADAARVRQVLTNLLDNAIKFTPAGGTIEVAVRRHADAPGFVRTSVQDSGPGLTPDAAARVFDRMYQAGERVEEASRKGLGLGLYISRELIGVMGGRIWVESGRGAGATFSFILPADATHSDHRG